MKTVEEIKERLEDEKQSLKEETNRNSCYAGMIAGYIDALTWVLEDSEASDEPEA